MRGLKHSEVRCEGQGSVGAIGAFGARQCGQIFAVGSSFQWQDWLIDYDFLSSEPYFLRFQDSQCENPALEALWEYQRGQPLFLLVVFFETKLSSAGSIHRLPCDLGKVTASL